MADDTLSLFAYGTLRKPRLLEAVLGHPLTGLRLRKAMAPGYRAVFYPGRVYPALVPAPGEIAVGLAVDGLSPDDFAVLDRFEGEEYQRAPIALMADGKPVPAQYYQPLAAIGADGPAWDFDAWARQHGAAMIFRESETAATLRQQLTERQP